MSAEGGDALAIRIVRGALDSDPVLREDYIRERCADDPALEQAVRQLLLRVAEFDPESEHLSESDIEFQTDPIPGSQLGPFRVMERIGRGGMGIVYRAEREGADFRQSVAIKLIRHGFDFDEVRARFLRERRILARLHHPNLVGFIDGGVAADGRPWFALEHVRGETIKAWSDSRRLDVRRRVRLFLAVCAAVQYAHTQLIVHRDLKPGNILIEESGTVKLLDFGISHLLEGDEADGQTLTVLGQRIAMTPEYAAPEQFRGDPAGVAGDVYSLGVILYELLSGVLPYPIDRRDLSAAERLVREAQAQPLAQAITRAATSAVNDGVTGAARTDDGRRESAAQRRLMARDMSLRAYQAAVRGDLSRILSKALEKDPGQRYSTVAEFAGDLGRWLDGVPVRVSGRRLGYRVAKFVARNRLVVVLAAVIVLATVAGIAGTLMQLRQSRMEAERANAVQNYLISLLESAAPGGSGDQVAPITALLQDGINKAQAQFADRPLVYASMLVVLGRVHNELSLPDQATPLLQKAIDLLTGEGEGSSPLFVDALLGMGDVHLERRRWEEAEKLARRGLQSVAARDYSRQARLRRILGFSLMFQSDREAGRQELLTALGLMREVEDPPGRDTSRVLNSLAVALDAAGPVEESVPYFQEALAINRRLYGEVHFRVAINLVNLGANFSFRGLYKDARLLFKQAISIHEQVHPSGHTSHATALGNLALVEIWTGHPVEAEALLNRALTIRESIYAPDDPHIAQTLSNMSLALGSQQRWQESMDLAQRAVDIFSQSPGDWQIALANAKQRLARAQYFMSRFDESEDQARESWEILLKLYGEGHAETVRAQGILARAIHASGRVNEAHDLMVEALGYRGKVHPNVHGFLVDLLVDMGDASGADNELAQALVHYRWALDECIALSGGTDARTINLRLKMARVFMATGSPADCHEQRLKLLDVASQTPLDENQERALKTLSCDSPEV